MLKRSLLVAVMLALATVPAAGQTPQASPTIEDAVTNHVDWVESLFGGGSQDLTESEIGARFDANFLSLVPPDELITTVRQHVDTLGPLERIEKQPARANEFIGTYQAESGDMVMISLAVDPGTALIAGFFITPAPITPAVGTEASPVASPVAPASMIDDAPAQIARYREQLEAIRAVGEPVRDAVLAGDDTALEPYLGPLVASAMTSTTVVDVVEGYTTRQVQMAFPEVNVVFFGQWNDREITGLMVQNEVPYAYALVADSEQESDLPTGRFRGVLSEVGLEVEIRFAGAGQGELSASLSIPMQGVADVPMSDVRYLEERPIGEMVDERVIAPGGVNDSYTADYAWGDHLLRLTVAVDPASGLVNGLHIVPAIPTAVSTTVPDSDTSWRLPFEGVWWVLWGGEDALRNYHVSAPSQRYAYDLVVWKDGVTWQGTGTRNEDHWIWGEQVLAPAAGEVVAVVNDETDLPPNASLLERTQSLNPGGNHVVLKTAEAEYVMLAHMQQGTVQVTVGDRVTAGDHIGLVGNSGNSSEPHLHVHVQDTPDMLDYEANGIPMRFDGILVDGEPVDDALPIQGSFIAPAERSGE